MTKWHTNPKPTLAEKLFRSYITGWYAQVAFISSIVFLLLLSVFQLVLPRLSFTKKRPFVIYSARKPSRAVTIPLVWVVPIWIIGISYFLLADTQQEFIFLAKRLGRIPVSLFPAIYFLSLRPSPLPKIVYLQLIPLHKWLSRLIVLVLLAHAVVYFAVYVQLSKLGKLLQLSNISGIIAFFLFILIGLSSLKPIRRRYYNVFYSIHYVTSWVTLPLIYYHSKTSKWYMIFSVFILLAQIVYRLYSSKHVKLPVQYVSPNMFFISIPRNQVPKSLQKYYTPGSHLRISNPLYHISTWFQSSHPYTIASLPQDPNLTLVIRKTHYPIKLRKLYAITGPFRSIQNSFFQDVNQGLVHRALFIAGGSGIAFVAPIMRHLRSMNVPVKLLWAIRDRNEVKILETLGLMQAALVDNQVEVYVTRGGNFGEALEAPISWYTPNDDERLNVDVNDDCCGGEFRPLLDDSKRVSYGAESASQTSDFSKIMYSSRPVLNLRIKSWLYGIPVDRDTCCCLDQLTMIGDTPDASGLCVLASGAEALVHETENWASSNGFSFYKDEFSL